MVVTALSTKGCVPMKIARSPYHASIAPHKGREDFLWFCVIRREGSAEVVVRHDAASKEDACCAALWELVRLQPAGDPRSSRQVSPPRLETPSLPAGA